MSGQNSKPPVFFTYIEQNKITVHYLAQILLYWKYRVILDKALKKMIKR